jgi:hypothetical protein
MVRDRDKWLDSVQMVRDRDKWLDPVQMLGIGTSGWTL